MGEVESSLQAGHAQRIQCECQVHLVEVLVVQLRQRGGVDCGYTAIVARGEAELHAINLLRHRYGGVVEVEAEATGLRSVDEPNQSRSIGGGVLGKTRVPGHPHTLQRPQYVDELTHLLQIVHLRSRGTHIITDEMAQISK